MKPPSIDRESGKARRMILWPVTHVTNAIGKTLWYSPAPGMFAFLSNSMPPRRSNRPGSLSIWCKIARVCPYASSPRKLFPRGFRSNPNPLNRTSQIQSSGAPIHSRISPVCLLTVNATECGGQSSRQLLLRVRRKPSGHCPSNFAPWENLRERCGTSKVSIPKDGTVTRGHSKMSVSKKQLFTRHGSPRKGVANVLSRFRDELLIDGKELSPHTQISRLAVWVHQKRIIPNDLFRLRGNGNADNPGLLAQYLFNLPSGKQKKQDWSNYTI